jgi:hypothetical protein
VCWGLVAWWILSLPGMAAAADVSREDAPWSVSVGAGYFMPEIEDWKEQYGRSGGWMPVLGARYAIIPAVAIGGEVGYFTAESFAESVSGRISGELQRLMLWPVTVSAEAHLRLSDDQLLVPFVNAGYRRVAYRLAVQGQDSVRGGAGGVVMGAGFDVLLDRLDPASASGFDEDYGVARTYLRLEAQWTKVDAPGTTGDVELGGKVWLVALKFDF